MRKFITLLFVLFISAGIANAQGLEEKLQKVGPDYAKLYMQPLVDALGTNMNSNYFYDAYVPFDKKVPIGFNVGIRFRFMNTFMSSDDQKFNFSYADSIAVGGGYAKGTYRAQDAPTAIGDKTEAIGKFYDQNGNYVPGQDITLIGGAFKTTSVPFFIPEITFGTLYGTDGSISFLPKIKISDVGSLSYFGFTLRHNISHYFPKSPVDIAVQGGYQGLSFTEPDNNDLWKSGNFFINGQVSKTYKILTGYAALQYENFKADFSYNYLHSNGTKTPVKVTVDGNNNFRFVIGGTVKVGFFAFNLDANIGKRFAISSGINFIIL
ncbi:MAG: DUF6588 family protein [Candidatus Kapaibacterium sp.]